METEMTKAQAISQMILDQAQAKANFRFSSMATDVTAMKEAIDFVLGAGTYDRLVSDLYDELRAKASK
jgi:hypothetical protein